MTSRYFIAMAMIAGSLVSALPAAAQGCSGATSCSATNTASVTVGALVKLDMSSATTTLTAPTPAGLAAGYMANAGPSFTIHANQAWALSINADSVLNPTNWDYSGSQSGVKPISDLTWSVNSGSGFAALSGVSASVASDASATNNASVSVYFRTVYSSDYSALKNRPGTYSLPVVFTLAAP